MPARAFDWLSNDAALMTQTTAIVKQPGVLAFDFRGEPGSAAGRVSSPTSAHLFEALRLAELLDVD